MSGAVASLKGNSGKTYSQLDAEDEENPTQSVLENGAKSRSRSRSPPHVMSSDLPSKTSLIELQETNQRLKRYLAFLIAVLGICLVLIIFFTVDLIASSDDDKGSSSSASNASESPKNLIVLIGDGMGTSYNGIYRIYNNLDETTLDKYYKGRYTTRSSNATITDSANGAFAFSCGNITHNGFIGVDEHANPVATILEACKYPFDTSSSRSSGGSRGTGIISTSRVTHATPASFSTAHVFYRNWENLIALQQGTSNTNSTLIDVMLGGGRRHFIPSTEDGSKREDSWDFVSNYQKYGWNTYVDTNTSLYELDVEAEDFDVDAVLPLAGLFADSHLPYYLDRVNMDPELKQSLDYPGLLDMTKQGLQLLDAKYGTHGSDGNGFFLMIEGSRIDMCGHSNDIACLVNEMQEFDDVLKYVFEWAESDANTLVVVLADHETGGVNLGRGTSVQANNMEYYITGDAPKNYNITGYYGDFNYNFLVPVPPNKTDDLAYSYIYDWFPQDIANSVHTASWIVEEILLNSTNLQENGKSSLSDAQILSIVAENYLGGSDVMTRQEQEFISSCLKRDYNFKLNKTYDELNLYEQHWNPVLEHCVVMLMNARTLTGWTSHGHSGADVSLSCYGPGCDNFAGHHTNAQVGQLMLSLMGVDDEQALYTADLEQQFLDGTLIICDDTQNLGFYGYDHNVSYPWGNLRYGQYCVEAYV